MFTKLSEMKKIQTFFSLSHLYHKRIKKIALNFIRSSMFASGGDSLSETWSRGNGGISRKYCIFYLLFTAVLSDVVRS